MGIGEKIRFIRKEENFTQAELGRRIGVSGHNVFDWESGKCEPSLDTVKQIAAVFGVSVGYLVGAEDETGRPVPQDLSEKDKELLKAFHKLRPFEQETVLTQIGALVEKVKK